MIKICPGCGRELNKEYPETCKECGWISDDIRKNIEYITFGNQNDENATCEWRAFRNECITHTGQMSVNQNWDAEDCNNYKEDMSLQF